MTKDSSTTHNLTDALTVLIVEPSVDDRTFFESILLSSGFRVSVAETFHDARALLDSETPRLLVTELRLAAYNGLHLVMRGRAERPNLAALVTSAWRDPVLQAETEHLGATFVAKPTTKDELLAAVLRTCFREPADQDPIRPPFERRHITRRMTAGGGEVNPERRSAVERRRSFSLSHETVVFG